MSRLALLFSPVVLAARRILSDLPLTAAVFGVVLVTSFVFAAVPRTFASDADDGLRFAVAHAHPFARNIEVTRVGRIAPATGVEPFAPVTEAGERSERRLPASIREVTGRQRAMAQTLRYMVVDAPGHPGPPGTIRLLNLEYVQGATDRSTLVDGRFPTRRSEIVRLPFRGGQPRASLIEVAVSEQQAEQLSLRVGDRLYLAGDSSDPLVSEVPLSKQRRFAVEITGVFAPKTSADRAWLDDADLGAARIRDTDQARYVYGFALFGSSAYRELAGATKPLPLRYAWRFEVDASGFDAARLDRLEADVRAVDARFGQATFGQLVGTGVHTGLTDILATYRSDHDAAVAVLAVGATGLLALALAVVALLGTLAANRRGEGIALLRSRGGTHWQVLGAEAVEGVAVAVPAGALGYVAATLGVSGGNTWLSLWLVIGIVAAAGAILAAAASGAARRGLAARGRDEAEVEPVSPRRLALESVVVVLSAVGIYLLRRRGLAHEGGFDPYLAAVPLLLGLAAGILAVRLYPLPTRMLAALASRRRDLVPALALRRVARQPGVTAGPLLVLLVGVTVCVFAAAMAATIARGQTGAGVGSLSPLATGTLDAFRKGAVLAGAYAAFVIVLALLVTARSRLRDMAYLRALGLSSRQAVAVTAGELAPPFLVASAAGIVLGVGIVYLVEPGLDLSTLAAGGRDVSVRLDPVAPVVLVAALLLVSAAAVWATGALIRRMSLARSLRMGER
ncbi:MAG TPA: ABC transporter permease [Gaiellaceae bacterium]|nr:ABC transporter permease [Gaiellaceae bacterium]